MASNPRQYLDTAPKEKYPVGKIAGLDSHSYNGSSVMHKLVEHVDKNGKKTYTLACRPTKPGIYNYMGYKVVISCARCKKREAPTSED